MLLGRTLFKMEADHPFLHLDVLTTETEDCLVDYLAKMEELVSLYCSIVHSRSISTSQITEAVDFSMRVEALYGLLLDTPYEVYLSECDTLAYDLLVIFDTLENLLLKSYYRLTLAYDRIRLEIATTVFESLRVRYSSMNEDLFYLITSYISEELAIYPELSNVRYDWTVKQLENENLLADVDVYQVRNCMEKYDQVKKLILVVKVRLSALLA